MADELTRIVRARDLVANALDLLTLPPAAVYGNSPLIGQLRSSYAELARLVVEGEAPPSSGGCPDTMPSPRMGRGGLFDGI